MEISPETTAARTALWRALHLAIDPEPHVLTDDIGRQLLSPDADWRERADMEATFSRPFRASIVGRARFVEDLVEDAIGRGANQYVILGAGLDSFAQRRRDLTKHVRVFEIDQPGPQLWKQRRLAELGLGAAGDVSFVPVDFEAGEDWWAKLEAAGFDPGAPAVIVSTGVSMYLTKVATAETLATVAKAAPGSTFAMSFLLPFDLVDAALQGGMAQSAKGAKAGGTPFISFFTPDEIQELARQSGCKAVSHVSGEQLARRYFADRQDGLRPPNNAENFLVAGT